MKIVFPKEMKIRTAVNAAAIVLAICSVFSGLSILDLIVGGTWIVSIPVLLFGSGGLHFMIANYFKGQAKSKKGIGKTLFQFVAGLTAVFVGVDIAIGTWLMFIIAPWQIEFFVPLLSIGAGAMYFLMAKIMWSLKKTLKLLGYLLLAGIAAIGIFADLLAFFFLPSPLPLTVAMTAALVIDFIIVCASVAVTIIGYLAESKLIKMKYLVYSK